MYPECIWLDILRPVLEECSCTAITLTFVFSRLFQSPCLLNTFTLQMLVTYVLCTLLLITHSLILQATALPNPPYYHNSTVLTLHLTLSTYALLTTTNTVLTISTPRTSSTPTLSTLNPTASNAPNASTTDEGPATGPASIGSIFGIIIGISLAGCLYKLLGSRWWRYRNIGDDVTC